MTREKLIAVVEVGRQVGGREVSESMLQGEHGSEDVPNPPLLEPAVGDQLIWRIGYMLDLDSAGAVAQLIG